MVSFSVYFLPSKNFLPAKNLQLCKSLYSVQIWEIVDQKNSEYGHFSRSAKDV